MASATTPRPATNAAPASPTANQPAYPDLLRVTGVAGVAAGALIVTSQLVGLWLLLPAADQAAQIQTLPATVHLLTKLAGFVLLPLALLGTYLHQAREVGRLGLAGFVTATVGTVLTAGDWWFETFAVTWLARVAPELVTGPPPLPMMAAAFSGFALLAIGTVLLGLASTRARVLPRWVGVLLVVGGVPCLMAGTQPFLMPFGWAVAVIGWAVLRAMAHLPTADRPTAGTLRSV